MRTLVWFRAKDLRLADHRPLYEAARRGEVVPLFVLEPRFFGTGRPRERPHRMQFLLDSLHALDQGLRARGSRLLVVAGEAERVVPQLLQRSRAERVVAHAITEPVARARDQRLRERLGDKLELYAGETLLPPGTLRTRTGKPFSVFGKFARAFLREAELFATLPAPRSLSPLPRALETCGEPLPSCEALGVVRNPRLLAGGEGAARLRLQRFLRAGLGTYGARRDRMDLAGTSRLSADLKFGTLSVREVYTRALASRAEAEAKQAFGNELLWRELAYATLWDRPEVLVQPFQPRFRDFPFRNDGRAWRAWTQGQTGYPVVDAAARQLLEEGFVHNRARMITASFLSKHLLIDFRRGEAHFMRHLTDADRASNDLGWQWSAGCGCDAQPYFRIFNPVAQGERFDPDGHYVRRYVPELAALPARFVHRPWEAPREVLRAARVRLGKTYPRPIVDHREARARFLLLASQHLRRGE